MPHHFENILRMELTHPIHFLIIVILFIFYFSKDKLILIEFRNSKPDQYFP